MSGIHLLLLRPWVCSLCGSCLTPARPHESDCSRLIVAVLPAHGVSPSATRCLLLVELQSSSRPGHFCLLGLLGAALRLSLSSVRVMFSHHDTDHRDVRVHFAKRQIAQDLRFSSCLKRNLSRSSSRSCQPIAPVFFMLRVSQHVTEPGHRLSPEINRRMRCSDESS